jgi:hypothetical protein
VEPLHYMLNTGGFCQPQDYSIQDTAREPPPNQCDRYLTCRQPIRGVVYPHIRDRQRRAARQLLFVIDNACAVMTLQISNLIIELHYCVGDIIMPVRSNNSSQQAHTSPSEISLKWLPEYLMFCLLIS